MKPIELLGELTKTCKRLSTEPDLPNGMKSKLHDAAKSHDMCLHAGILTPEDVCNNMNDLYLLIGKALDASPKLRRKFTATPTLLDEAKIHVKETTGQFENLEGNVEVNVSL